MVFVSSASSEVEIFRPTFKIAFNKNLKAIN